MAGEDKSIRQEIVERWIERLSIKNKGTAEHVLNMAAAVKACADEVQEHEFKIIRDCVAAQFGGRGNVSRYRKIASATWLAEDLDILPRGFSPIYYLAQLSQEAYDKVKSEGKIAPGLTRDEIMKWSAKANNKERPPWGTYSCYEDSDNFSLTIEITCIGPKELAGIKNRRDTFLAASRLTKIRNTEKANSPLAPPAAATGRDTLAAQPPDEIQSQASAQQQDPAEQSLNKTEAGETTKKAA